MGDSVLGFCLKLNVIIINYGNLEVESMKITTTNESQIMFVQLLFNVLYNFVFSQENCGYERREL